MLSPPKLLRDLVRRSQFLGVAVWVVGGALTGQIAGGSLPALLLRKVSASLRQTWVPVGCTKDPALSLGNFNALFWELQNVGKTPSKSRMAAFQ